MCDYEKPEEQLGKNVGGTFPWWDVGTSGWHCAHDDNLVLHVKESLVHSLLGERELPKHVSFSSL